MSKITFFEGRPVTVTFNFCLLSILFSMAEAMVHLGELLLLLLVGVSPRQANKDVFI